jgi:hypothetical protein
MCSLIQNLMNGVFGKKEEFDGVFDPTEVKYMDDDYFDLEDNIPGVPDDVEKIAEQMSIEFNVPKPLLCAIMFCESAFRKKAFRFEPGFKRRYVERHKEYGDLPDDEKDWLSTSHGLMQIMGLTALELGYQFDTMEQIYEPEINIEIGAFFLRKLFNRHKDWNDAIASYNAGSPRFDNDGNYVNQSYVDKVNRYWSKYRS